MHIHEMSSQDMGTPSTQAVNRLEELVAEIEEACPSISSDNVQQLRKCLSTMHQWELSDVQRMEIWRLSYRIWNTCVDMVNNLQDGQDVGEDHAELRQVASDLLVVAGPIGNARSSSFKMAMFYSKTGYLWHKIRNYLKAATCFEKAFELCLEDDGSSSQTSYTKEQVSFFFDLYVARAKTVWELATPALACNLLGRARSLLSTIPDRHQELAEVCFEFGKALLAKDHVEMQADSVKYMENGLDICSEALSIKLDKVDRNNLERLRQRILRHLAAAHLQNENFESALRCVAALKLTSNHPSTSYFALRAFASLGRYDEVERELFTLLSHGGEQVDIYVSALEIVIQDSGQFEAVEKAFFILLGRFSSNRDLPVKVLEKLLRQEPSSDPNCIKRVELALKIACDERVLTMVESRGLSSEIQLSQSAKEQMCIHALLWTSGSEHFQARMYQASVRLFEASMLYIVRDGENCKLEAKSLRVLCLCYLALSNLEQAAEVIEQAERLDVSITTIFFKTRNEVEACKQVERMLTCSDLEPEFLTLACHEAIACKSVSVAVVALSSLLSLYPSERVHATGEVIVLRNLITLLIQEGRKKGEILMYFRHAQMRLEDEGCEKFFGSGSNWEREAKWFSGASWNQAMESGKEQDWKTCSELNAISADFYAVLPETPENLHTVQTALLLCVSALLAMDEVNDNENVKSATIYLERCRKVHRSLLARSDAGNIVDDSYEIYVNLLSFELKGRLRDDAAQLQILKRCSSLPGFSAEHYYKMGLQACNRKAPSIEVATAAFCMTLNVTLSAPTPNYDVVGAVIRKMITVANLRCKSSPEVLNLYKQAHQILLGLGTGVYPKDEAQWLVSTAWNRAALHYKMQQFSDAELWMGVALDILKHVPSMEIHRSSMMESLSELLQQKGNSQKEPITL